MWGEQRGQIHAYRGQYALFETRLELVRLGYGRDLASATLSDERCETVRPHGGPDCAVLFCCGERWSGPPLLRSVEGPIA